MAKIEPKIAANLRRVGREKRRKKRLEKREIKRWVIILNAPFVVLAVVIWGLRFFPKDKITRLISQSKRTQTKLSQKKGKRAQAELLLKEGKEAMKNPISTSPEPPFKDRDKSAYIVRGDVYKKRGEFLRAIAEYKKGFAIDPKSPKIYYKQGLCYLSLKKWDKAIDLFTQAIKIDPEYAAAYTGRAMAYQKKPGGVHWNRAIDDFEKAHALSKKKK